MLSSTRWRPRCGVHSVEMYDDCYNMCFLDIAVVGGVRIEANNLNVEFIHTSFERNNARWDGGGFYLANSNANITFVSCNFLRNVAEGNDGGGIYIRESNSYISFEHSIISFNRADSDKGGGMYVWKGNTNVVIFATLFRYAAVVVLSLF
jgi:hypothetical protein